MSELGQHLKAVREEKGITLEDLQTQTKIQKRYLVAIEEGNFSTLPGIFYARAFIKSYAESIGLDPEELFDQYEKELPNPQKESAELPSRRERSTTSAPIKPNRTRRSPLIPLMAGLLFLAVVAAAAWLVVSNFGNNQSEVIPPDEQNVVEGDFSGVGNEDEDENETDPSDSSDSQEEEEQNEEEEIIEDEAGTLTFTETQGNTAYYELDGEELKVDIIFNGDSYVDIRNSSGDIVYSAQTSSGEESFDYSEEESVLINLGSSSNVEVLINDELVEYELDIPHQKINIEFTAQ
ncbi:helix-turn-helix domain-containing protein [Alkalihalobacillus trypoxylicola]|uniref:HTH cro/C1-type domain-containing protein n=1 Tax=Alkalihalobacillus trypoxylicola TaxID=519424 RepID=A0A162F7V4_9BACI|nr:RodZ domain-containing protein [Alkalihalobacillus trypoxylicola]KYG34994.1 hypothetical protein AZF04_01275 [Alkalihalobacillus trypoxylicola]